MELTQRTITKVCLFLILINLLTACSKDCFVADTYEEIRNSKLNNNHLYLYLKTAGFNEKEHFFQLYLVEPEFDECGIPSLEPVAEEHIDTSAGNVDKLIIKNRQIKVIYSKIKKNSLKQIIVELD